MQLITLQFLIFLVVVQWRDIASQGDGGGDEEEEEESKFKVFSFLSEEHYKSVDFLSLCETTTHLVVSPLEPSTDGKLQRGLHFPPESLLNEAREFGCHVVIGFGAHQHSGTFEEAIIAQESRSGFISEIAAFINENNITGVDYFSHPKDAATGERAQQFYNSFASLVLETRQALGSDTLLTVSYSPNGQQEALLAALPIVEVVDYVHIKAFDLADVDHHAPLHFMTSALQAAADSNFPAGKLALGLPLFGRQSKTDERISYEYLTVKYNPIDHSSDAVLVKSRARINLPHISFNGRDTIMKKVAFAVSLGLGGVSVFEAGDDCRVHEVARDGEIFPPTCPDGRGSSMINFIGNAIFGSQMIKQHAVKEDQSAPSKQVHEDNDEL